MAHTEVKCPRCHEVSRTAKSVSPGTKVRCGRCKTIFPFRPAADGSVNDDFLFDRAEPGPLREQLASGTGKRSDPTSDKTVGRYGSITNQAFDPEKGLTFDRMVLKSERYKERLRGGKPQRFEGSRKFMGFVVILVVSALGYAGFVCFVAFFRYLNDPARVRQANEEERLAKQKNKASTKGGKGDARGVDLGYKPVSKSPRITAPEPLGIDGLENAITEAKITQIRMKNSLSVDFYLALTVRIQNRSQQPVQYKGWHSTRTMLTLTDRRNKSSYDNIRFFAIDLPLDCISDIVIAPKESILDLLVFKPPPFPYPSLEFDLPSPIGNNEYRFSIPSAMIGEVKAQ